jgi:hypothetical protein
MFCKVNKQQSGTSKRSGEEKGERAKPRPLSQSSLLGRWGETTHPARTRTPAQTRRRVLLCITGPCASLENPSEPVDGSIPLLFETSNPRRTPSRPFNTMKAVPSPASATKAASHARPCPRLPAMLPRRPAAVDSVRAQQLAPVSGRSAIAAGHANRAPQHARRHSGSKHWFLDAKVNKPTSHRNKIGLWLENVDPSHGPSSPTPTHPPPFSSPRCKPSTPGMTSPNATQIIRQPGSPRIPLADITALVLAAETPASFYTHASDPVRIKPQPSRRSPGPASDLTGAVDMLTPDEAKQLLLLSAQSNTSLAYAIRGIAVSRTPRPSPAKSQESYLADTFRFDEQQY